MAGRFLFSLRAETECDDHRLSASTLDRNRLKSASAIFAPAVSRLDQEPQNPLPDTLALCHDFLLAGPVGAYRQEVLTITADVLVPPSAPPSAPPG